MSGTDGHGHECSQRLREGQPLRGAARAPWARRGAVLRCACTDGRHRHHVLPRELTPTPVRERSERVPRAWAPRARACGRSRSVSGYVRLGSLMVTAIALGAFLQLRQGRVQDVGWGQPARLDQSCVLLAPAPPVSQSALFSPRLPWCQPGCESRASVRAFPTSSGAR